MLPSFLISHMGGWGYGRQVYGLTYRIRIYFMQCLMVLCYMSWYILCATIAFLIAFWVVGCNMLLIVVIYASVPQKELVMLDWFLQNIEGALSEILTGGICFFLGVRSSKWINAPRKNMTIKGSANRMAEKYYENNSTNIEVVIKNIKKESFIDYSSGVDLCLGASGTCYTAPADGALFVGGITGKVSINNKVSEPIFPEGKQILVKKKDSVIITYNKILQNTVFKFFYRKETSDD